MLGIEMKLLTAFHSQTDGQMEQMNQKLKQYLQFLVDHKQKDWLEWLASAKFAVNNKVHMANYRRELRMGGDIRKKEKVKSATEFVKRMKKVHEEVGVVLKKVQEDMKRQADSVIQGASREAEKRGRKTNKDRRSQRVEGGKNIEQKKNKRSRQISGAMEEVYGRS